MLIDLISSVCAVIICGLIFSAQTFRSLFRSGVDVQDSHSEPVSRLGGLSILVGIIVYFLFSRTDYPGLISKQDILLVLSACVFFIGLFDDLSGHINQRTRLVLVAFFASLYGILVGWLDRLDIFDFSLFGNFQFILMAGLTILGIVGLTNAFNIVDGLNGLCSGLAIAILIGLALICNRFGLQELGFFAAFLVVITFGFWLVHFPRGKLILGDGGAYLLGFLIAGISILANGLIKEVSSWSYLLLCSYPVVETLFSIFRRIRSGGNWDEADKSHLHQLVHIYVRSNHIKPSNDIWHSNAIASILCIVFALPPIFIAVLFSGSSIILMISFVLFVLSYVTVYRMLRGPVGGCP